MKSTDKDIAEQLCRLHKIDVAQARYREDGNWYHPLTRFPGAFLDKDGVKVFKTKSEYESCKQLSFGKDVNLLHKTGIKSIPGYSYFTQLNTVDFRPPQASKSTTIVPRVSEPPNEFDEGGAREITLELQKRDPRLRRLAIRQYGTKCQVCGFDFKATYGQLGEGFIELHHLNPLSLARGSVITTLEDVAVVCSNCHRMLHRHGIRPLAMDELRQIIKNGRTA